MLRPSGSSFKTSSINLTIISGLFLFLKLHHQINRAGPLYISISILQYIRETAIMTISAKVYEKNGSYLATIRRSIAKRMNLKEGTGLLLKTTDGRIFPTVVRRHTSGHGGFMLSFTIPKEIATNLPIAKNRLVNLCLISRSREPFAQKKGEIKRPFIDLFRFLPLNTQGGRPFYIFEINHANILVWVYTKKRANPFILPCQIPLEKEAFSLLEIAGAFFSEGLKARTTTAKHIERLEFSNADEEQIKWFLESMKKLFNIPLETWRTHILYGGKLDEEVISKLKSFWVKCGPNPKNITVYRNVSVSAKHGICCIYIEGIALAEAFFEIYNICRKLAFTSKKRAICFLRGVFRGDVGIRLHKNRLKAVNFSTDTRGNANFFHKLCSIIGLNASDPAHFRGLKGEYWYIEITGYESFKKIIQLDICAHAKRSHILRKSFLDHRTSRSLHRYLKAIDKGAKTTRAIANKLDRFHSKRASLCEKT